MSRDKVPTPDVIHRRITILPSNKLTDLITMTLFGALMVSIIIVAVTNSRVKRLCDERKGTLIDKVCIVHDDSVKIYKD